LLNLREGNLKEGRSQIQLAMDLDPVNFSSFRSYLPVR
jgi:hypothetical protein